jgi:hypothetical protein
VYPAEQGFHLSATGDDEAGSELGKGLEDEHPLVQARVRNGQAGLVQLLVAVEEKVEIERPWPVLAGDPDAAEALLDCEQPVEEFARG